MSYQDKVNAENPGPRRRNFGKKFAELLSGLDGVPRLGDEVTDIDRQRETIVLSMELFGKDAVEFAAAVAAHAASVYASPCDTEKAGVTCKFIGCQINRGNGGTATRLLGIVEKLKDVVNAVDDFMAEHSIEMYAARIKEGKMKGPHELAQEGE